MNKWMSTLIICCFFAFTAKAECVFQEPIAGKNLPIGTLLTWSTSYEENTAVFVVEKSVDGGEFEEVGTVNSAGDSQEFKSYNYLDLVARDKRTFYRLKLLDNDGTSSFSDIVAVNQEYTNNFMVTRMSAVATNDLFELTFDVFEDGDLSYALKSIKGNEILRDEMIATVGLNNLTFDLKDQSEGIYKIELVMGDEAEVLTVMKVEGKIKSKSNTASKD